MVPHTATDATPGGVRTQDAFLDVLDQTLAALGKARIPFLLIGGIGSAVFGRDRGTSDIDVFVRPESVPAVLGVLGERGFRTRVEHEHWLSKAFRHGVLVDVISRSSGDILLDEGMLERARSVRFRGRVIPVAAPEDLIVMKAVAANEETPRYWYDAIAIIAHAELDWGYLVERARRHGVRRILSLLLFADSLDLVVPRAPIEALLEATGTRRSA